MIWFIILIVAALVALATAAIRAGKTNKMSPAEQEKLRRLTEEVQRIGSPDPKDMPW